MNQEIRAQFTLSRYSPGDALQFIVAHGTSSDSSPDGTPAALPGLSKLLQLQEKHYDDDLLHRYGCRDPLYLLRCAETQTHEQWCAHSQTACALAKNTVSAVLQERIGIRVHRYGEALLRLASAAESSGDVDEGSVAATSDSAAASPNQAKSDAGNSSMADNADGGARKKADDEGEDDDDEEIETYMQQHPAFATEMATAWLQRRYLRCCELMNVRASVVVSQRLSQAVQLCLAGSTGSFFASGELRESPLSPLPPQRRLAPPSTARSWLSFPETLVLLREQCAIPYEVNPDFHGCRDIGKQPRHFIALMGLLEGCHNTVVSLNLANTGLADRELRVLCLFCHAHLRRLRSLDLSNNPGVTDKMAPRLKKMAASLPLLTRLLLHGTSLSQSTVRVIDRLLSRKVL